MRKLFSLFLSAFLLLYAANAFAQNKEGANWLFGGNIHLDFNKRKPTVESFSYVDTMAAGVATISDKNGNLLFFSSGGRVGTRRKVNGVYQEMPNGNLMAGINYRITWAEMIVPSPADSNIYYLFFLDGPYGNPVPGPPAEAPKLHSVQIDMRLNNGLGDVVPNSRKLLRRNTTPIKLTAMLHSNNHDTWVVTQNASEDSILAYLLTPSGIMTPVETKISVKVDFFSLMKASPNSEMFVINSAITGSNISPVPKLELFEFNRTTGVPTHKYSLTGPAALAYDWTTFLSFAFSSDNTKLYAGTARPSSPPLNTSIYQFDLAAGNAAQVQQSGTLVFNSNTSYHIEDMQLGIDGKIYFTITDAVNPSTPSSSPAFVRPYLGQISCPNFYGPASRVKVNALEIKGVRNGSLPALNQTLFRNADKLQAQAYRSTICAGDSVQLSVYGAGAEKFKWEPANGLNPSSDTLANPFVSPTVTTTYKVTGFSDCRSDTTFVTVTVLYKVPGITVSGPQQVISLTNSHEYFVPNPTPGSKFYWQVTGGAIESGQGTSTIKVNWGRAGEGIVSVFEDPLTGCNTETVSLKVQLTGGPEPIIYNIFTPDNDGKNDAFTIQNLQWYPENELKIYNRWGVEVYQSMNYKNDWQADNVSAGTYYYFFKTKNKSWKGWVEVVK